MEAGSSNNNSGDDNNLVSGGIWATALNVSQLKEKFSNGIDFLKSMQKQSDALDLGMDYTDDIAKAGKYVRGVRIVGGAVAMGGLYYDYTRAFGNNPSISKTEFWTNAGMTILGFFGSGVIVSTVYFGIDAFYPGGAKGFLNDNHKINTDFQNATGWSMRSLR